MHTYDFTHVVDGKLGAEEDEGVVLRSGRGEQRELNVWGLLTEEWRIGIKRCVYCGSRDRLRRSGLARPR